jgi:hypothetical protein
MERWQTGLRFALTVILFAIVIGLCVVLLTQINTQPTRDANGGVIVDQWQRGKDVLSLFLPLLTTALGYWFGAAGKDQARADAAKARDQLTAVTSVSTDSDILAKAKQAHGEAFR